MKPFFGHPKRFFLMILAIIAVGVIATTKYYSDSEKEAGYKYQKAGGDSVNVAIHYSPMSIYRYGDTLGGLNYEILRTLSAEYGDKFKYYPISSASEGLENLEKGIYDLLVADIPMTAQLKKKFIFTTPVYTDHQVLVSRDTTISNPLELAGKDVWVVKGTPATERLENLSREIGDTINIRATSEYTAEQLVLLTAKGKIPRAVVNEYVAKKIQQDYPQIKVSTQVSFTQFQSWLINKEKKNLADKLNKQIRQFKETQHYDSIMAKWTSDAE